MNLLPHKSWNVWNKDNIEKVKRDEKNDREVQLKKRKRQEAAEQEIRYKFLKENSKKLFQDNPDHPKEEERLQHINFFSEFETGANPEYEAEKKKDEEKRLKQLGLATCYLGQGSAESMDVKPWYYEPNQEPELTEQQKLKTERFKNRADPLSEMNKYLKEKKQVTEQYQNIRQQLKIPPTPPPKTPPSLLSSSSSAPSLLSMDALELDLKKNDNTDKTKEKKEKKEKKDKKDKKKDKKMNPKPSIEELRRLRIERERVEKERASSILKRPDKVEEKAKMNAMGYSNQFSSYSGGRVRSNRSHSFS